MPEDVPEPVDWHQDESEEHKENESQEERDRVDADNASRSALIENVTVEALDHLITMHPEIVTPPVPAAAVAAIAAAESEAAIVERYHLSVTVNPDDASYSDIKLTVMKVTGRDIAKLTEALDSLPERAPSITKRCMEFLAREKGFTLALVSATIAGASAIAHWGVHASSEGPVHHEDDETKPERLRDGISDQVQEYMDFMDTWYQTTRKDFWDVTAQYFDAVKPSAEEQLNYLAYARIFASTVDTSARPRQSSDEMSTLLDAVMEHYKATPGAKPSDVCRFIATLSHAGKPLTIREGIVLYTFALPQCNIDEIKKVKQVSSF